MKPTLIAFLALAASCPAQEPAKPMGSVTSTAPVTIDGTAMSPTGSPSWPVMDRDEIATQAPTSLTTNDHNVVILSADTKVKVDSINLIAGEGKKPYIFLRQGGLSFDAKSSRIYICAAGRLFVPETLARGTLSLGATGVVSRTLLSGVFAEEGKRSCTETGAGQFLTGVPGAAGGVVGPVAGGTSTSATVTAAALGVGVGAAAGVSAFLNSSFNPNPTPISTIQP